MCRLTAQARTRETLFTRPRAAEEYPLFARRCHPLSLGPHSQNDHRCRVQAELGPESLDNGAEWHYALIRAITLMANDSLVMQTAPGWFHERTHVAILRRFS